jgi:hypothetical protein
MNLRQSTVQRHDELSKFAYGRHTLGFSRRHVVNHWSSPTSLNIHVAPSDQQQSTAFGTAAMWQVKSSDIPHLSACLAPPVAGHINPSAGGRHLWRLTKRAGRRRLLALVDVVSAWRAHFPATAQRWLCLQVALSLERRGCPRLPFPCVRVRAAGHRARPTEWLPRWRPGPVHRAGAT